MKDFLEAAMIVNTHGIRGDMKVEVWCDSYDAFKTIPNLFIDGKKYRVTKTSPYKGMALIHLEGIESCEQAEMMKGKTAFAARTDLALPQGRVFIADIIGLPVKDAVSGMVYGTLADVIEGGAGQLYEIDRDNTKAYMPAIKEFIDHIDEGSAIYVTPPEGLFE